MAFPNLRGGGRWSAAWKLFPHNPVFLSERIPNPGFVFTVRAGEFIEGADGEKRPVRGFFTGSTDLAEEKVSQVKSGFWFCHKGLSICTAENI